MVCSCWAWYTYVMGGLERLGMTRFDGLEKNNSPLRGHVSTSYE